MPYFTSSLLNSLPQRKFSNLKLPETLSNQGPQWHILLNGHTLTKGLKLGFFPCFLGIGESPTTIYTMLLWATNQPQWRGAIFIFLKSIRGDPQLALWISSEPLPYCHSMALGFPLINLLSKKKICPNVPADP